MGQEIDKKALLNKLKIDSVDNLESIRKYSSSTMLTVVIFSIVISSVIAYALFFLLQGAPSKPNELEQSNLVVMPDKPDKGIEDNELKINHSETLRSGMTVLNASGFVAARRVATVSSEVLGLIKSVVAEEGVLVQKGDVLALLDDSVVRVELALQQARVEAGKARINSIEADVAEAKRNLARFSFLEKNNLSSEAQRSQAETNLKKLTAQRASAIADMKVAELSVMQQEKFLEKHQIRAPYTGVVTYKGAQAGEIVSPSSAGGGFTRTGICTIVDMDSLEIDVDVNEAYIGKVSSGQRVVANLDAYPDWDIAGSVIAIIPTANRAKATIRVRVGIEKKDPRILPNMGVKVAFLAE